jgi:hypothetical protein
MPAAARGGMARFSRCERIDVNRRRLSGTVFYPEV